MKNKLSIIRCLVNIIQIQVCYCSIKGNEFSRFQDYDGKTCTEDKVVFRNSTPSSIVCSSLCTNYASCTGVYYKPVDGSCVGCSASPLSLDAVLDADPGTTYMHHCKAMDDWSYFDGSKYIIFKEEQMSMLATRVSCKELCGDLVRVNSMEEQTFLANLGTSSHPVGLMFIGLTDTVQEGRWRWLDDETEPVYYNWYTGEPDNYYSDENCVAYSVNRNYRWLDIRCSYGTSYTVCEKR